MAALVLGCSALGCGSDESGSSRTSHGTPDQFPPMSLPSTCEIPNAPAAVGRALVVGDGTPESCTNAELQAAASAGGDIIFDCGAAAVTIPITSTLVVAKDASIDGGGKVTLDGQGTVRILSADNYVNVALRGLTFTRGLGTTGEGAKSGGAVRGGWRGSLDIRDCNFTDNEAGTNGEEGGGAIYTPSRTTLTVVNCRFTGNRAGTGGALFNLLSGLTVVNSVFVNNQALAGGGGGVYTDGASDETDDGVGGVISLCGCRFQDNIGKSQGGAAYLFAYSPDHVIVNQCIFERNQVLELNDGGALGGGLRVGNAQLDLEQSLFVGNHSDGHAGGLWVDGAYPSYVTNSTFSGNDAGVEGATDAGDGGAISGANLSMLNLTIVENRAVSGGGGIFNEDTTSTLTNSVLS
ncbi:MAG TPA: hypothetical protein VIV60_14275, partial [Polyangiaceae bacterium]